MELVPYDAHRDRCPVLALPDDRRSLLAVLQNGIEGRHTTRRPNGDERVWLEARAAQLGGALAPGPYQRLVVICANLLLMFQIGRRWDAGTLRSLTVRYAAMADDLPAWAVAGAAGDLARGKLPGQSLDFPPTPARLCGAAREYLVPIRAELWAIERILKAVPTT